MRRATRPVPHAVEAVSTGVSPARATATATAEAVAAASATPGTARALIRRLQSGGWTSIEAGNLAAIALGLQPARTGWTGSQLDHLRFVKSLATTGRIEG